MSINKIWQKFGYIGLILAFFLAFTPFQTKADDVPEAQWAKSTSSSSSASDFWGSATDSSGNTYAVGYFNGGNAIYFSDSVGVRGGYDIEGASNALIVKFNSSGEAVWARSTGSAFNQSWFGGVAIDQAGNVYTSGAIFGNEEYDFGDIDNHVNVTGAYTEEGEFNWNPVIVKYNCDGVAQWARSTESAENGSFWGGLAVDSAGDIYAIGNVYGDGQIEFGNEVTFNGGYGIDDPEWPGMNGIIVKYDSSGQAQWGKTAETAPDNSSFDGLTIDSSNNIYVAANLSGAEEFDFGGTATVTTGFEGTSGAIIKYNLEGTAQWVKSVETATESSQFRSVDIDSLGNIYVVGEVDSTGTLDYGNSVTVTGQYGAGYSQQIVKFNSTGTAQWAKTVTEASNSGDFNSIKIDDFDNIYVAGYITDGGEFNYGNGVVVSGGFATGYNAIILRYDTDGIVQWAKTTESADEYSWYYSLDTDSLGNIYTVGSIGDGDFDFGDGQVVSGQYADGENAFIVKYYDPSAVPPEEPEDPEETDDPQEEDQAPIFSNLPNTNVNINITEDQQITTNPFVIKVKPISDLGIERVEFYIDEILICTSTAPDSDGVYSCEWDTSEYHSLVKVIAYDNSGNSSTLTRNTVVDSSLYTIAIAPDITELPATGRGDDDTNIFLSILKKIERLVELI